MGGKNEGKLGLDIIDEQLKASARGLLASVKQAKRVDAFAAWQEHAFLETSISLLEREVKPYEAILNSLPQDRSKEDVRKICGLLRQMSAYKAFAPHILEFIGTHCQLMVVWEGVELPRTGDEASNLYNVLYGHMQCVMADPRDPLIQYAVHDSAQQILKGEEEAAAAEARANPRSPKSPQKTRSPFTMEPPNQQSPKAADSHLPAGVSPHESSPYICNADTVCTYNLPPKCQTPSVACKLWCGVLDRIRAGRLPPRAEAEELLASIRTKEGHLGEGQHCKQRSSQGGRAEGKESAKRRSSGTGDGSTSNQQEGGGPLPLEKEEHGGAAEQPQGPGQLGGPNNPWPKVAVYQMGKGESFSGRELDCCLEVGLMEGGAALEIPPRAVAALPVQNSMAAMLHVSRAIYRRALDMVQEHTIGHAVNRCCRLPFLRHTPLKELYKLARHLHEVRLSKGDTLIEQGKENSSLYFLIEGEVEVVVDVPYSDDRELLESALLSKMQVQDNGGAEGRSSVAASVWSSRNTSKAAAYSGPLQRVVMARRGPGSILGDDSLRERKTAVGVVVSSSSILALAVPQQRFAMSLDALTLRLFMRLKQQQGALPLMSQAVSAALLSKQKVDQCRKVILSQALSPNVRTRKQGETSDASEAEARKQRLSSTEPKASHKQRPSMGWNKTSSHASDPPMLSLASGDRADNLAALHKKNEDVFELEMRQQALAERGDHAKSEASSAPSSPGAKRKPHTKSVHDDSHAGSDVLNPSSAAALKSLNWSKRTMPASMLGADSRMGQSGGSGRASGAQLSHGSEGGGGDGAEEQGLGDLMAQSMQTSWMDKIHVTESVAQLRQMIKQAAEKRRAEVLDQEHRNWQGRSNLVNVDARIVHKLDISVQEASGSTHKHTTMLESACIAVIKVHLLPGQAVAPCDALAPVLDDAVVGWSASAHSAHLQLVRWSSFEYALVARIDPSESKRAAVKATADCLLEMKRHFDHTIATNAVPHYTFRAGLACGGAFAQHNGGHFLSGISGTAVKAAQLIADAAVAVQGPHSCILISDVTMQAICRTHVLCFGSTAWELLDRIQLPCNTSFNDIFGPGNFEAEPVAQGTIPSEFQGGSEEEEQAAPISRERHRPPTSSGWAGGPSNTIGQSKLKAHSQSTAVTPKLGDHEQRPASPAQRSGKGSLGWPESQDPERFSAPACLWVDIPDKALDPGLGLSRVASPSYPPQASPAFPSPQGSNGSFGRSSSRSSKPRRGPANLSTLEPEPRHSRVAGLRSKAELASSMDVRQRLRQDLQASRSRQAQQLGVACMGPSQSPSPSPGNFFGGLQGGLKTWGYNGRARKALSPTLPETNQPWNSQTPPPFTEQQQQQQRKHGWPWASLASPQPMLAPCNDERIENEEAAGWHGGPLPAHAGMPPPSPILLHYHHQQQQQQQQQHAQASHSLRPHQLLQPQGAVSEQSLQPQQAVSQLFLQPQRALTQQSHSLHPHPLLQQQQQARPRTSSPRSPLSTKPDVFPHFVPSSRSPLASLSARHRASEVLFTGAALASSAHQLIRPVSPGQSSAPPLAHSPIVSPHSSSPPLQTLGETTLAHDSLNAALQDVVRQKRASPERLLPQRPDSALQALHRPLSAQQQAFAAAVALDGRPKSAGSSIGEHGPLRLASPSLRLRPAVPSSAPATPPGRTEPHSSSSKLLPSNHGFVPASMLQYPRCARPQPGGAGLSEQDTQGTRSWYPPPHTPLHPSSAPLQEESMAASPGRSPYGDSIQFGEFVLPLGSPAAPAQPVSAQPASRTPSATTVASRSGSACPKSRIHTPSFLHSRQVDPYTGMSLSTVHEQAISTWKDLGSLSAAQEYVEQLPPGQVNVTFSAAGLATLPDLSRLMFMESLAASFNSFHMCPDPQAILGSRPHTHLGVLCMSHCGLTELPCNIGRLLPALTELNLAHNSITEPPLSLFQCSKLRAISLEHNQLCTLPDEVSRLSVLEALYLGSNSLQALPGCLPCLQMLGVLDVKRNEIKELPANLPACTQLVVLSVAYNRLTALPPSFLDALSNLRWLELQGNSLRSCPQVNGTQVAAAVVAQDAALTHTAQAHTAATEARAASLPEQAHSQEQTSGKGVHRHGRTRGPQEQLLHRRRAKGRLLAPAEDAGGEKSCGTAAKREAESEQPDEPAPLVEAPLESAAPGQDLKSLQVQQQQQQQQQQALQASSSPAKIQKTTSFSENLHARAHRAPSSSILENEAAQEVLAKSTPCRLPNLHWLNLANNRLALPPLWLPSNLTGLDLSWNRLSNVPAWLVDSLPQLQMLALHGNCITEVCRDIKRLSSLKMVSLNENPVTDPGNAESGSWVSECVCTAKFDHKLHLEAELQRGKLGEREPSRLSS